MRPRKVGFILALLAVLLLIALPQNLIAQSSKSTNKVRNLVIHVFQGEVHLSVPGQPQLVRVRPDMDMKAKALSGVGVITNNGWAEYSLDSRLYVAQESESAVTFGSAEAADHGFVLRMTLERGTSTFTAEPGRHNAILIEASGIEVRATRKARFRIDADPSSARVTVFEGKVKVTSPEGTREVAKGFSLTYQAGAVTRLAQRRRPVRTYGGSSSRLSALAGLLQASLNFNSNNYPAYSVCGWYYGALYSPRIGYHNMWPPSCSLPYNWANRNRDWNIPHSNPPTIVPPPTPTPTPRPIIPRPTRPEYAGRPQKYAEPREFIAGHGETRQSAGSVTTTASPALPRFAPAPGISVSPAVHRISRDDAPLPRQIGSGPIADRVDVSPIPRERASGRGNDAFRPIGPAGSRDSSNHWSGNSGPDRAGSNPGSGSGSNSSGGSSGNSSGGGSPAAAPSAAPSPPPAAPPPAPAGQRDPPNPKTGKPD